MSVIIRDLKMPANCGDCPMQRRRLLKIFCTITKQTVTKQKRSLWCPLFEAKPIEKHVRVEEKLPNGIAVQRVVSIKLED